VTRVYGIGYFGIEYLIGYLVTLTLILTLILTLLTLLNPINPNRDSKAIKTASVRRKSQNGHLLCFVLFRIFIVFDL